MLATGDLVGASYRIVRLIGEGGMGEVYEALHEPLSRRVALKKIRGDVASDEILTRFRREAEASAALGHPNIVQVTDFVLEDERSPAMIMELLEGRTLRELVAGAQRLEPSRAVFIALQILSGLAAAHDAGIIHRDVKPANVFLQKTLALRDHVKLLDFGVAKLIEGETGRSETAIPVTRRGSVLGTRAYMAPEQASGEKVDARADLYAVGATLYYALSGWKPRDANPSEKRQPLSAVAKDVPAPLAAIVDKALADRPEDRFASAVAMAEALADFSNAGIGVHPSMPPPVRHPTSATTTVAAYQSATMESGPKTVRDERFVADMLPSGSMKSAAPSIEEKPEEPLQIITKKMAAAPRPGPAGPNPFADTVPVPEGLLTGRAARSAATWRTGATAESPTTPVRPWYLRGQFFVLLLLFVGLIVGTLILTRGAR